MAETGEGHEWTMVPNAKAQFANEKARSEKQRAKEIKLTMGDHELAWFMTAAWMSDD